jgi:UDP-2,3-diacylglucosamine pyrophosphatase LpxH
MGAPGRMPARGPCDIVLLSDLHMSAGREPRTGAPHRMEDFLDDEALVGLLDHLRERSEHRRRALRLVALGDLLDFTRVELDPSVEGRGRLDTSVAVALEKVERVAVGHPEVIEALGRLVGSGAELEVVPGNHDLELMLGAVRERLATLVASAAGDPGAAARVRFRPWIFYVPGVLYAEHGQQHHDVNRVADLVSLDGAAGLDPAALPLASHAVEYVARLIDALDPSAAQVAPLADALRAALRRGAPSRAPAALAPTLHALWRLASSAASMRRLRRREPASVAARLEGQAQALGLEPATLAAIDGLSLPSPTSIAGRAAREAVSRRRPGQSASPGSYMTAAATAVHGELARAGAAARFYVFGHTHVAADVPLGPPPDAPRYLNPGTWSRLVHPGATPSRGFVEIALEGGDAPPQARLWRWDPAAGERELVPTGQAPPWPVH